VIDTVNVNTADNRELQFSPGPGLTVLCGGNGAGKSSTLGALWRCLSARSDGPTALSATPPWMVSVSVGGTHSEQSWETSYDINAGSFTGECPVPVHYLDATASTEDLIRRVREDDNPDDLIEGIDPASLDPQLVDILSLALRRKYEDIFIYEVTQFSADDDPLPFFGVSSMGEQYDLRCMGRGELSTIYLIWALSQFEPRSIVLIEEPECHLATYSQRLILDVLVYFAVECNLTIIASSHSPGLFQPLPNDHTVLVTSLPLASFQSNVATSELAEHLGLDEVGRTALVVVEDYAAATFFRAIIGHLDHVLLRRIAICHADTGESGVQRIMAEVKDSAQPRKFKILAVLDGDMRTGSGTALPHMAYLPGEGAPEQVMRDAFEVWRRLAVKDWIPPFAGGVETLELELDKVSTLDHHDWLQSISQRYGGPQSFVTAATDLVLKHPVRNAEGLALTSWLRGLLES
jgi:predicted ATPase